MKKQLKIQKLHGISPYIWAIFFILPFYFIFKTPSTLSIVIGIILNVVFFCGLPFCLCLKGLVVICIRPSINRHFDWLCDAL